MKEIKRIATIEDWPPPFPFPSYYDDRSTEWINPTAAAEQNPNRYGLLAVCGRGVSNVVLFFSGQIMAVTEATKRRGLLSIALGILPASYRKIMVDTAVIAHKNAEGGHIEQENRGFSEVREISEDCIAKLSELTSKNEVSPGLGQAAYEHCLIALKAPFRGNTASDKQTCSFPLAGWLHRLWPELATNNLFSQAVIQLTELLSASTKFVCRIIEGVSWIFSKNVFVLVLLFPNPPVVSAVDTYIAVVSPPSLQPLNMALQLAPPPPPPPMRATRRGFRRLGPPSPSKMKKRADLTESKTEWGLSPKPSPPSCFPEC